MKKTLLAKVFAGFLLCAILLSFIPAAFSEVRIMSYNIKDFWLRFDGEPQIIVPGEGAMLEQEDLSQIATVAGVINRVNPDVVGILECASLTEIRFFNQGFLANRYQCFSFRAYDSRISGIPLGLLVRKDLKVESINLVDPESFSDRGIIVADIVKQDYHFTLILVHFKSKIEQKPGTSALKRNEQGNRLREIIQQLLEKDPKANIIICGDFNDEPGLDHQEKAAGVADLIETLAKSITLSNGQKVALYNATLLTSDRDKNKELWTVKSKGYPPSLFDYFFLTEGSYHEFKAVDHIYPEEFTSILEASDHIPVVLYLQE